MRPLEVLDGVAACGVEVLGLVVGLVLLAICGPTLLVCRAMVRVAEAADLWLLEARMQSEDWDRWVT